MNESTKMKRAREERHSRKGGSPGSDPGLRFSRRRFLSAAAAATVVAAPGAGWSGRAPSERVHLGCIGTGDQGTRDMKAFLSREDVRVVAVCDVLEGHREGARGIVNDHYGNARCTGYSDFRRLLEREKALDAVLVVTPDHWHAAISAAAMRLGKHVYCQKPLTHTVREARRVAEVARETGVATQLGTVNQASEDSRRLREWIWSGAIGPVREVHNWSNRPIWPQGVERPLETPPVPAGLDWDLWVGPAPFRPYHPAYLPLVWRGWWDFGTGALGDMGCYSFDTIFRALKLGAPRAIEASSSAYSPRMWAPLEVNRETYPRASIVRWEFPERGEMPPVTVTWYDGGLLPPEPPELEGKGLEIEGLLFVGDRGKILCGFAGANPRLIPDERMRAFAAPPPCLLRSPGHHEEWIAACRGGPPAGASFEFSGPVTEALLLGNVAIRARRKLEWDAPALTVRNLPEAEKHLHFPYRQPWKL